MIPALNKSPRRARHGVADRELLIRNVLEAVGARRDVMSERSRNRELELLLRDVTPVGSVIKEKTSPPASPSGGRSPPSHRRSGGLWPVFLLWVFWDME